MSHNNCSITYTGAGVGHVRAGIQCLTAMLGVGMIICALFLKLRRGRFGLPVPWTRMAALLCCQDAYVYDAMQVAAVSESFFVMASLMLPMSHAP